MSYTKSLSMPALKSPYHSVLPHQRGEERGEVKEEEEKREDCCDCYGYTGSSEKLEAWKCPTQVKAPTLRTAPRATTHHGAAHFHRQQRQTSPLFALQFPPSLKIPAA